MLEEMLFSSVLSLPLVLGRPLLFFRLLLSSRLCCSWLLHLYMRKSAFFSGIGYSLSDFSLGSRTSLVDTVVICPMLSIARFHERTWAIGNPGMELLLGNPLLLWGVETVSVVYP